MMNISKYKVNWTRSERFIWYRYYGADERDEYYKVDAGICLCNSVWESYYLFLFDVPEELIVSIDEELAMCPVSDVDKAKDIFDRHMYGLERLSLFL